jgi:acyl-homoserine-lactone acylase
MTELDMARLNIGVGIRYGLGRVQKEMASAAPPVDEGMADVARVESDFSLPVGYGSNAVGLGRALTESGRGLLFGNPHYPWHGSSRFHLIHLTLPGEVDVMGVSLLTTSRVSIGFNKDIAWSHTVSTALRSTFYELTLHPEDPLQYQYGDGYRPLEAVTVPVTSSDENGQPVTVERTVYFSHYGPVVESDALPWTHDKAYAVRDVNLNNGQSAITYDALSTAGSVADVEAAISEQGVAWTNTVAADRHGDAFYGDISLTPNVDADLIERCRVSPEDVPGRVMVLDGARAECEWREDERAKVDGALPAGKMPRLTRSDYVANSNDSYWLTNPEVPLEGFSPIIGAERTVRSLRTRAGLTFIAEAAAAGKIGPDEIEAMLGSHRNFGAELLLDDVLEVCTADMATVDHEGSAIDVTPACAALAGWDRRMAVDSRGGHVWREFWRTAREIDGLYAVPFDVNDPVSTPRGIAVDRPEVREALLASLATAQTRLTEAGIPLDARLGDIQFAKRNGERIPVPGGEGWAGMWSMIIAELNDGEGYSHIRHGNSYMQVISWDEDGNLDPRAIVTYSQSPEPESPHYADMTHLYAKGEWLSLPFSDAEIDADPNLEVLSLRSMP